MFNVNKYISSLLKINFRVNNRLINFDNRNKILKMNEAYFKHLSDEGKIAISFRFVHEIENKKIDRVFNFVRDLNEDINVSLNRIRNNLEKEFVKKQKKKKKDEPSSSTESIEVKI